MKFHWMYRGNNTSVRGLEIISKVVDYVGYESILMVYHSNIPDFWIKAAHVLNLDHKFKYMPAIRTYALSPEYFYMMYRSFEEIAPDRIMFNIISGDIHADENSIDNLIFINDKMITSSDRLVYTKKWIEQFLNISKNKKRPEIIMSGHSDETKMMARDNGFTHLSMLDMYLKGNSIINKKQMVALSIFISNFEEELESFKDKLTESQSKWTIYGTKKQVKEKIEGLSRIGISDIMISSFEGDPDPSRVHNLIKEMIEGQ